MASMQKSYFLVPTWDFSPQDIVLGSVIPHIKCPQRPLSSESLIEQLDGHEASTVETKDISGVARLSTDGDAGLFATFVQYVTAGGKMSYKSKASLEVKYSCGQMETHRFSPSIEDVNAAVRDTRIREWFKMGGYRATVFLVTGIKVVYNVSVTTSEIGPGVGINHGKHEPCKQAFEGPIVFAFGAEKIRKQHISGTMRSTSLGGEADLVVEKAGGELDEDEIDDLDVETTQGIDDQTGEACVITLP
ncbi:hypothetical protein K491DRAFT_718397 [Lophiostoma macrostomum CBS 122681]|uniref:Uncharacterized protein n=1 Tax=Lophiostoma macrostomum CBS 122681 TaxID=1314788 RepID=A0A6A6SZ12_9PLEO|nr:hypothetical protein K491DRAFT_718397 [Lophiostoma macrostomum CBS 122681]